MKRETFTAENAGWAAVAVVVLAVISILPVIMVQLSGPSAAGVSAGFVTPFEHKLHIVLFALAGLVALRRGSLSLFMLPLAMFLMLAVGGMTDISMAQLAGTRMWLFAFVLMFALVISVAYSRAFFIAAAVGSAFAYFAGTQYIVKAPDVASLGYFLVGNLLAIGLVMAIGASLGLIGWGYITRASERLQRVPAFASFMGFL